MKIQILTRVFTTMTMFTKAIFFLAILLVSCNKEIQNNADIPTHNEAAATISKKDVAASPVTNPGQEFASTNLNSPYSSIKEIIKAFAKQPSTGTEPSMSGGNPPSADSINMVNMNVAVANYLQKYPVVGYVNPSYTRDPDFVLVTLVYACLEESGALSNGALGHGSANYVPVWFDCIASAVGGYFGIEDLIKGLGTFEFGTVWTVVKFAIKKYVGWIGAALLIYHIATDCF